MEDSTISDIIEFADILEKCDFELFWTKILSTPDVVVNINGFFDSIRKFVCNVINITFQTISTEYLERLLGSVNGIYSKSHTERWTRANFLTIFSSFFSSDNTYQFWVKKYGWKDLGETVVITKQDENIKTKNITEKIAFESLSNIMAKCL